MITYTNSLPSSAGILPPAANCANFVSYDTKPKVKIAGNFSKPTLLQFGALQKAFDYFNAFLFSGSLPPVMLVLCRGGQRSATCYIPGAWTDDLANSISQIKINPATLLKWPVRNVYARLVHEMCHHWQHHSGIPGRNGYHNKEFAAKMKSMGLQCTSNGKANGKPTGQHITEIILEEGAFDSTYACLPADFILPFRPSAGNHHQLHGNILMTKETQASKNKIKYACPACGVECLGQTRHPDTLRSRYAAAGKCLKIKRENKRKQVIMQPFRNLYLQDQTIGSNETINTGAPILCNTDQQPESSLKENGKQTKTGNHATFSKFVLPGSEKKLTGWKKI